MFNNSEYTQLKDTKCRNKQVCIITGYFLMLLFAFIIASFRFACQENWILFIIIVMVSLAMSFCVIFYYQFEPSMTSVLGIMSIITCVLLGVAIAFPINNCSMEISLPNFNTDIDHINNSTYTFHGGIQNSLNPNLPYLCNLHSTIILGDVTYQLTDVYSFQIILPIHKVSRLMCSVSCQGIFENIGCHGINMLYPPNPI